MITTELTPDPCKAYTDWSKDDLYEACGLIPYFFLDGLLDSEIDREKMLEHMEKSYGFPVTKWTNATLDVDGVYQSEFEEDPPLRPYCKFVASREGQPPLTLYVYPYGILALRQDGDHVVTRMS